MFGEANLLVGTPLGEAFARGACTALFVQEAVRHAIDRGALVHDGLRWRVAAPLDVGSLDELLSARVRALAPPAQALADALAVLGIPATAAELATVADLDPGDLAEAFAAAARAGIVEEVGTKAPATYDIHDRFADACLGTADAGTVLAMHERSSRVLEARANGKDFHALGSAVAHSLLGRSPQAAARLLDQAVVAAELAGQPAGAARLLSRYANDAYEGRPPARLLLRIHDLARRGGQRADARAAFERLAVAKDASMRTLAAEVEVRRATILADDGEVEAAERALGRARRRARALADDTLETEVHLASADLAQSFGSLSDASRSYEHAARTAASAGRPELEIRARVGACICALHRGDFREARGLAKGAAALARGSGDPGLESEALRALGNTEREMGAFAASLRTFMRAVKMARRAGSPELEAKALNNAATSAYRLGRANDAIPALERSIVLKERYGGTVAGLVSRNNLGAVLSSWGDFEGGRRELEAVLSSAKDRQSLTWVPALSNLAELTALEGDLDAALRLAEEALGIARARGGTNVAHQPLALIARLYAMRPGELHLADRALAEVRALDTSGRHDRFRYHASAAMIADAHGDFETMRREIDLARSVDKHPSPCYGLFGSGLEVAWMRAICAARSGRRQAAERARVRAERVLVRAADHGPPDWSRERCLGASPIHRAIREATFDTPLGWTYRPSRAEVTPDARRPGRSPS